MGDFKGGDRSKPAELSNTGFLARWKHLKKSQEVHMYGRLHADICNFPQLLINGVKIQVKLTKARPAFYLLSSKEDATVYFKIQETLLYFKRIKPSASVMTAHNEALIAGCPLKYNLKRIELKSFTFSAGLQSLSMDNAVLGRLPKRLNVTMVKNTHFLSNMATNPFYFRHYDLNHFALYVNGKHIPPEGLSLDMSREKTAVMGYRTLFEGSGIRHSNIGFQISPAKFINGYFMLVFDLTPDLAASEGHTSWQHSSRTEICKSSARPSRLLTVLGIR